VCTVCAHSRLVSAECRRRVASGEWRSHRRRRHDTHRRRRPSRQTDRPMTGHPPPPRISAPSWLGLRLATKVRLELGRCTGRGSRIALSSYLPRPKSPSNRHLPRLWLRILVCGVMNGRICVRVIRVWGGQTDRQTDGRASPPSRVPSMPPICYGCYTGANPNPTRSVHALSHPCGSAVYRDVEVSR